MTRLRALLGASTLLLATACARDGAGGDALRVAYVAQAGERGKTALGGAELGAEEAERAAALVGKHFQMLTATAGGPGEARRAAERLLKRGAFAVVGGGDAATCRALADAARARGALFVNVGCREDALRGTLGARAFHVEGSETMYRGAGSPAVLWHAGLSRYGAAQLNERYRRRFGGAMEGEGWASWMAIKLLWEAAHRAGTADPGRLAAYLAGDARFDGHKGEPLSFGARDRQLQQPLYPAAGGAPEAGERARAGGADGLAEGTIPARGQLVLVTNEGSGDVTVIDAERRTVAARIRVGSRPRGIRMSPDGRLAYVALSDDAPNQESDRDAVAVIEVRTGRVLRRLPAGTDPEQFVVSPDGRTLFTANEDAGTTSITDLASGRVRATLVVGVEPEGVAVSPDGRWVYVTAETSNTVSVIDTRKDRVAASFMVDVRPRAAAFSPDGRRAYVTNEISGTVSVVDVATHQPLSTIPLGERAKPVGVVVSPDGSRVYVATGHAGTLAVIDARTERVIAAVPVGRRPWGVETSPDGRWIYTANGPSDDVAVVDARTLQIVAKLPAGRLPWGVAVVP
ncbi:MAG TPA: PQQ-dependent catabolism-associated beta-propeller protein [Longimicrobium sp.]